MRATQDIYTLIISPFLQITVNVDQFCNHQLFKQPYSALLVTLLFMKFAMAHLPVHVTVSLLKSVRYK